MKEEIIPGKSLKKINRTLLREVKDLRDKLLEETERCLQIIDEVYMGSDAFDMVGEEELNVLYEKAVKRVVEEHPHLARKNYLRNRYYFKPWDGWEEIKK